MDRDYELQKEKLCNILSSFVTLEDRNAIAETLLNYGAFIPPVMVDQRLYVYDKHNNPAFDRIIKVRVYAIRIDTAKNDKRFCVEEVLNDKFSYYRATFKWSGIGKSIFYTKEQAEEKMNRRKKK